MNEERILDLEGVMERLDGDHELYQEVVRLFLEGFPAALHDLRHAAAQQNSPTFGRCAHTCKGALGNIGAMRSSRKALQLEQAGKSGDMENASQLVAELEAEVAAFTEEYRAYLNNRATS